MGNNIKYKEKENIRFEPAKDRSWQKGFQQEVRQRVWTNYHTHCDFCHGIGKAEDYVVQALKNKVRILGFSCHANLPFPTDWTMTEEGKKLYPREIRDLEKKYADKIKIKLGLEIDYIPGLTGLNMAEYKDEMGLDYTIASVHYFGLMADGSHLPVDVDRETLKKGIKEVYGNNVRKAFENYYLIVQDVVKRGGFDILGHLDLIKKYSRSARFFSEEEKWYRDIVESTLKLIAKHDCIVEVNTGGMARNYIDDTYPSPWILERCYQLKIPLTLSSDAHCPSHVVARFEDSGRLLRKIGYKEIHILDENGWKAQPLTEEGLLDI